MPAENADKSAQSASRALSGIGALAGAAIIVWLTRIGTDAVLPPVPPVIPAVQASVTLAPAAQSDAAQRESPTQIQAREDARRTRAEHEARLAEEASRNREERLKQALAAREDADRAEQQVAKDRAWGRFYKPPKKCTTTTDQNVIVECSNHYMREQQRFEKLWADGKI